MRVRASQGIPSTWTCKPGNDGRKNRGAHPARILRNAILTRARPCADFPSNSHFFGENPRLAVVVGLLGMPPERVLCDLGEDPFFGIPVTRLALQDDFIPDLSSDERLDEFLDRGDPSGLPSVQLRIENRTVVPTGTTRPVSGSRVMKTSCTALPSRIHPKWISPWDRSSTPWGLG